MSRLKQHFQQKPKNNLNIYFTAGFPHLDSTEQTIRELSDAGVDIIEIGLPYSDPLADGETIQYSSSVALENGFNLKLFFEQIANIRQVTQVPLLLMGYLNQLVQFGLNEFCTQAKQAGIDGLIIPDMPLYNFEKEYRQTIHAHNLDVVFLVTPRTPEERIKTIDQLSSGFVYLVADSSITGKQGEISSKQIEYFQRINQMNLSNPTMIGFGISDHNSFETACSYANGAIIGSAFIRYIQTGKPIAEFVHAIKGNLWNKAKPLLQIGLHLYF